MRSRRNYKVRPKEVQGHAERFLAPVLDGKKCTDKCSRTTLLMVIFTAASRMVSLFAACLHLGTISDETVREVLRKCLPKRWQHLQEKLNRALLEPLPKVARRRRRTLAADVHEIPYHGEARSRNHVLHKKPKAGTTTFFAYATICIVEKGHRYTLGYTWVRRNDRDVVVLQRLLACVANSGVKIRRLLLDRGFFTVGVMRFLQIENVPFVMPVVFRGRKPRRGKAYTGLRAFLRKPAGWYRHTHRWKGQEVTVRVCVAYKSYRHHRSGRRRSQKLVFAAWGTGGRPTQLRELYRRRFGIEASYRQLGQARIRTSSKDELLRLFFVGVALLLRNIWVWLQWLMFGEPTPATQPEVKRFQFKRMLHALVRVVEAHMSPEPQLT